MRSLVIATVAFLLFSTAIAADLPVPETGVSGVFEVVIGTRDLSLVKPHFEQFGFKEVDRKRLTAERSQSLYGVDSAALIIRMQNGAIDSHGMLRIVQWQNLLSEGVGLAPPETVGVRMSVMRTGDIFRLADVFNDARKDAGEPYMIRGPVFDDLYKLSNESKFNVINRRSGVREMAVYGAWFNHVFFQRYGYTISGYGTIDPGSPLKSSEFTHHDFFIKGDIDEVTAWYSTVLGFHAEKEHAVLDGEWQNGPRVVFDMPPGGSHWYKGFVSPNNICGKLKFFTSPDPNWVRDRSDRQAMGHGGITMHTVWAPKISVIHALAVEQKLVASDIQLNEFDELSFVVRGPDGSTWQVIQRTDSRHQAEKKLVFEPTNN